MIKAVCGGIGVALLTP
ncbi:hypothetical protein NOK89_25040 [Vibrio parahaemolyticus]|nr:hypothetical protein [Vibrio parahaemolyticus]MCR9575397.1 hypothetical protein [Vibrio alginolyticus]MCR9936425.1 hypothetical protein [Vibrio antiquarius]MCS0263905.1 hypothetical protein [Vibrio alginolyticus]MCX8885462.1 hypothetical protein [Vibrio parahaemolyticus]MCZ5880849.1 hypothetical protein [Vibrio parahaemolyticus]